jgi:hypothetical protein
VNFFGHAAVARWEAKAPGFVLGSMLPDFATMSGTRLVGVDDPELSAGVALHHRTDRIFHGSSHFVALWRDAMRTLMARGLGRGPAQAVGHLGVELLLDGWLVEGREAREAYAAALSCGRDGGLGRRIRWLDEEGRARWRSLRRRLERHGPPDDYRDPAVVASRVERILGHRRRLALDARSSKVTAGYLPDLQREMHARAIPMIGELRRGLADGLGAGGVARRPHGASRRGGSRLPASSGIEEGERSATLRG